MKGGFIKSDATCAYPLDWPETQKRTTYPEKSRFSVSSFPKLRNALKNSLTLMGAGNAVISSNITLNEKGDAQGTFSQPQDRGVAVYFTYKGKRMVFACDRWQKVEDNVRAIHNTIDAIRGIERWGSSDMLEKAFNGFAQLPPPPGRPETLSESLNHWWVILDVFKTADKSVIIKAWKEKSMQYHPDRGGKTEDILRINKAYEDARIERGF